MPTPDHDAPTPDDVEQTARTLLRLTAYLRTAPAVGDVVPLLNPLVDRYDGVLVRLSQALRETGRYLLDKPDLAEANAVHELWGGYSDAAEFLLEWSQLDWTLTVLRDEAEEQERTTKDSRSDGELCR
ncbi:MAG: hypothetical protein JO362_17630 [Streptomycetaceae bacterium]|nr:hypothetical protein [Streptomycetaceae bacterium]